MMGMCSMNDLANNVALLRLLQLVSPALPVGAYAYSQGLEYAVEQQWLTSEQETQRWLNGLLKNNLAHLDIPLIKRLHSAWCANDAEQVAYWNAYLYANREAYELQKEDQNLGAALMRLLTQLELKQASDFKPGQPICFGTAFSLAATAWSISLRDTAIGYLWAWLENQVTAAIKLVPLGQTAGQRILSAVLHDIPQAVDKGLALPDEQIGFMAPGLAIACAEHETQYSRLFQS